MSAGAQFWRRYAAKHMTLRNDNSQFEVDRLLRRGIFFSILWLMGVGSIIAVISGLKAQRLIRQSSGSLKGRGRVWWCLVVGGLGLAFWLPIFVIGILNHLR